MFQIFCRGICEGFIDGLEGIKLWDRSQVSTLPLALFGVILTSLLVSGAYNLSFRPY